MHKKLYTRESLERALIHHGIDYSPPGAGRPRWLVRSPGFGTLPLTTREVYYYVVGLADGKRPAALPPVIAMFEAAGRMSYNPATDELVVEPEPKPTTDRLLAGFAAKRPPTSQLIEWLQDGSEAEATDGCTVELDGTCEHGKPSWLIVLGMI